MIEKNLPVMDQNEEAVLYRLKNEIFDTVVLVYNEDEPNEEIYFLTDMQGSFPETLEEVPEFDWVLSDNVDW